MRGDFNRQEMLADVRDAFQQLESSVSTAQVSRCRPFDLKRWAEGDVAGQMLEPMHPTRRQELDAQRHRREQEDEEFWAALRTVSRNFLTAVASA